MNPSRRSRNYFGVRGLVRAFGRRLVAVECGKSSNSRGPLDAALLWRQVAKAATSRRTPGSCRLCEKFIIVSGNKAGTSLQRNDSPCVQADYGIALTSCPIPFVWIRVHSWLRRLSEYKERLANARFRDCPSPPRGKKLRAKMNLPRPGIRHFPVRVAAGLLGVVLALVACSHQGQPPEVPALALDPQLATLIATSRQAVVMAPKSAEAWGRLGQAFHAADFFAEARVCYGKASELDTRQAGWPHLL